MSPQDFFTDLAQVFQRSIPTEVKQAAAEIFLADVQWQLLRSHDSAGRPFVPLKNPHADGTTTPMFHTGEYARSFGVRVTETGVALTSDHPGVMVHQFGAVIRPKNKKLLRFKVGSQSGGTKTVFAREVHIPPRPVGCSENTVHKVGRLMAQSVITMVREGK